MTSSTLVVICLYIRANLTPPCQPCRYLAFEIYVHSNFTPISVNMKSVLAAGLFSGLAAAHSAAWSVTVDGAKFVPRESQQWQI
jgi:hypothetical protein